jgi:hypothetical protein
MVHQDPAHGLGRHAEEMGPVLPRDVLLDDEAQKRFMSQGSRLQRVAGPFLPEIGGGQPSHFVVYDGKQSLEGRRVSS